MKRSVVFIVFLFFAFPVGALAWPGTVVSVHDGDTITVEREGGERERIRLFGIDCPELAYAGRWKAQPYSRAATDFVKGMFRSGKSVDVAIWEMGESYGRIVGGVIMLHNGQTVQEEMVRAGLAWVDARFCKRSIPECRTWLRLQQEAANNRRGLWKELDGQNKPIAPWTWRKGARGDE